MHTFEALERRRLFSAAFSILDLSAPATAAGFNQARVAAIDPTGRLIVGIDSTAYGVGAPILWSVGRHGRWHVTELPSPAHEATLHAVNASGEIVGSFFESADLSSSMHAGLWRPNRHGRYSLLDLGRLHHSPAAVDYDALAINASGVIVGSADGLRDGSFGTSREDAIEWRVGPDGTITRVDLSAHYTAGLPANARLGNRFSATAISDTGEILVQRTAFGRGVKDGVYLWRIDQSKPIHVADGHAVAVLNNGSIVVNDATQSATDLATTAILTPRGRTRYASMGFTAVAATEHISSVNHAGAAAGDSGGLNTATFWFYRHGEGGFSRIRFLYGQLPANAGWDALDGASGIDDANDIIGIGRVGGQDHAFLLVPARA
jgi:hypothetical protein